MREQNVARVLGALALTAHCSERRLQPGLSQAVCWSPSNNTWAKLLPVAILVWATILGVPVYLFSVSAPFNASSPSAYAAMLAARGPRPRQPGV